MQPGLQNDSPSRKMDIDGNLLESESKYKELISEANRVFGKEWSHAVTSTIGKGICIILDFIFD